MLFIIKKKEVSMYIFVFKTSCNPKNLKTFSGKKWIFSVFESGTRKKTSEYRNHRKKIVVRDQKKYVIGSELPHRTFEVSTSTT